MTAHRFRPSSPNSQVTEDQIKEVRALYEFAGWKPRHIVERTGLTLAAVLRIARGITGGKIYVTAKDLPDGVEPLAEFRKQSDCKSGYQPHKGQQLQDITGIPD